MIRCVGGIRMIFCIVNVFFVGCEYDVVIGFGLLEIVGVCIDMLLKCKWVVILIDEIVVGFYLKLL